MDIVEELPTGFQDLMPEGRSFPWKYLPRRGVPLSVTFGKPILPENIKNTVNTVSINHADDRDVELTTPPSQGSKMKTNASKAEFDLYSAVQEARSRGIAEQGWLREVFKTKSKGYREESKGPETAWIRSEITAVIQREVERLGRKVLSHVK